MNVALSLGGLIFKSFYGRLIGVALIALSALAINNSYQRAKGASAERTNIVNKTNEKAKQRNAQASKVRRGNPVSGAAKRLRDEYGAGAN